MKNLVLRFSGLVFLLCFGFYAHAQTPITEYTEKLNSMSDTEPYILDGIINGAPSMVFINAEGTPADYRGPGMPFKMMMLHKPSDLVPILNAYNGQLDGLQVVNIEWVNGDHYTFPMDMLAKLPGLEYVYIRSHEQLSEHMVRSSFQELVNRLQGETKVEILYFTMEKPG